MKAVKRFWALFLVVGALLGFVTAIYAFLPRISVVPAMTLNSKNPLTTPFTVRNDSLLPIHNVLWSTKINKLESKKQNVVLRGGIFFQLIVGPPIKVMRPGETTSAFLFCPIGLPPLSSCDVALEIKYRPSFLPWIKTEYFRFTTAADANGELHWCPTAESEERLVRPE